MTRIVLSGCSGRMGSAVAALAASAEGCAVVAGIDVFPRQCPDFPVFSKPDEFVGEADVLIDFSNKAALEPLLAYCTARRLPAVLCTTGYSPEQLAEIDSAAKEVPLFRSANMSLGVNVLAKLVEKAAAALPGFDIEIIEKHHNKKLDAPSGTALILADAAERGAGRQLEPVYDRHSVRRERGRSEIGISSIRGGTIIGEHEVLFAGANEVVTLSHSAQSREVFASGALAAARFLASQTKPRLYSMDDLIANL